MHIAKWKKPIWKVYTLYDSVYKETLKVLVTQLYPTLWNPHGLYPTRLLCPWDFPGKNTGMGCCFLLQRIFPTQRWKLQVLHWQADSLPQDHLGSPQWNTMQLLKPMRTSLCTYNALLPKCIFKCKEHNNVYLYPSPLGRMARGNTHTIYIYWGTEFAESMSHVKLFWLLNFVPCEYITYFLNH